MPKDTSTYRPRESNQRPSYNKTLALPLSHSHNLYCAGQLWTICKINGWGKQLPLPKCSKYCVKLLNPWFWLGRSFMINRIYSSPARMKNKFSPSELKAIPLASEWNSDFKSFTCFFLSQIKVLIFKTQQARQSLQKNQSNSKVAHCVIISLIYAGVTIHSVQCYFSTMQQSAVVPLPRFLSGPVHHCDNLIGHPRFVSFTLANTNSLWKVLWKLQYCLFKFFESIQTNKGLRNCHFFQQQQILQIGIYLEPYSLEELYSPKLDTTCAQLCVAPGHSFVQGVVKTKL